MARAFKQYEIPTQTTTEQVQSPLLEQGDSLNLGTGNIQSPNFSPDKGWQVDSDGNATFNSVTIEGVALSTKGVFGGDGSDGDLTVSSGTTTLSAGTSNVLVKNYTNLTVASGATLTISTTATQGTILILRIRGTCTIAGTLELTGKGATVGYSGYSIRDSVTHYGGTGGNYGAGIGGTAGTGGAIYTNLTEYVTPEGNRLYRRYINLAAGSAGGTGGNGDGGTPGTGGTGGGAVLIECDSLNFTGTISVNGGTGGTGTRNAAGCGGGGGGASGMALVLYNSLVVNTGTVNAKGGAGGNGGDGVQSADATRAGGGGGGGAGGYTTAGFNGAAGTNYSANAAAAAGVAGTNTTNGSGAGGGGGAGAFNAGGGTAIGGSGGTQGATDTNLYLITQNYWF